MPLAPDPSDRSTPASAAPAFGLVRVLAPLVALGAAAGATSDAVWPWAVCAAGTAAAAVLLWPRDAPDTHGQPRLSRPARRGWAALCTVLALAGLVAASAAHQAHAWRDKPRPAPGAWLRAAGVVHDVLPTARGVRLVVRTTAHADTRVAPLQLWVHLSGAATKAPPAVGDRVRLRCRVHPMDPALAPGAFDAASFGRARRLDGRCVVRHPHDVLVTGHEAAAWHTFAHVRGWLRRTWRAQVGDANAAVLLALVVGETTLFTPEQRALYARVGAGHLLAVSGLQVTLLAGLAYMLARRAWLRLGPRHIHAGWPAASLSLVVTFGFVTLCGAPPSAVRAGLMAAALLVAKQRGGRWQVLDVLALGVVLTCALDPLVVFDASFLLSYTALLGLLLAAGDLEAPPSLRGMAGIATWTSVATGVLTLPITAALFATVAPGGLLANIVLVPVATWLQVPAIAGGVAGAVLGLPWLSALGAAAAGGLEALCAGLDGPLGALLAVRPPGATAMLGQLALLAIAIHAVQRRRWRRALLTGPAALVWLALCVRPAAVPGLLPQDGLVVQFLPVGQGDSALLVFPEGTTMLIDGGGTWDERVSPGIDTVLPALARAGVDHVDIMVVSHPDPDHILGLISVARALPVGQIWHSGYSLAHPLMARLVKTAHARGIPLHAAADVFGTHWFGRAAVTVLAPAPGQDAYKHELSPNENSLMLRVAYAGRSVLFAGDAEEWAEAYLLERSPPGSLKSDVVKVGHHGSRTSSGPAFVTATQPAHVVYCTGRRNQFGFPHPTVAARWAQAGATAWNTGTDGLVTLRIGADSTLSISSYAGHRGIHVEAATLHP